MNWKSRISLRASGAAGWHLDKRSRRARTRQAQKTRAFKDQEQR